MFRTTVKMFYQMLRLSATYSINTTVKLLKNYLKNLMAIVFVICSIDGTAQDCVVNIIDRGADKTGKIECTEIIKSAIDSLSIIGGGEVYIPSGKFLSGPIELKSHITLNISEGAVLKFTDDFNDYLPMVKSRWEGVRVNNFKSAISAYEASDITIKGRGIIDGNGKKWWDFWWKIRSGGKSNSQWEELFDSNNEEIIESNVYIQKMGSFLRPPMIMPYACSNIRIEGVTLKNPAFWTIMPAFCENVTIDGITIINPEDSPNTDGIDPSSCKNVRISNSHISVGDDCIVIKSGRDEDGRDAGMATENVTITNCTMLDGHGGVVIGSEMSGGVKRVTISNCVFKGTDRGIRIKTMRGRGGSVEDICVSNIVMYDIEKEGIMINMHYHETSEEPVSERTPAIKNISISNIRINEAKRAMAIYGLKERYAENISIANLNVNAKTGIYGDYAGNIDIDNVRMNIEKGNPVEFKNSNNIQIRNLTINSNVKSSSVITLSHVENVLVKDCFQPGIVDCYLSISGQSSGVYVVDNVLPGVTSLTNEKKSTVSQYNNLVGKK